MTVVVSLPFGCGITLSYVLGSELKHDKKSLVVVYRPVKETEPAHTNYKVGLEAGALTDLLWQNRKISQLSLATRNP